jgi:hypothetical protein
MAQDEIGERWGGVRPPWPDWMSKEEYLSHPLEDFDRLPPCNKIKTGMEPKRRFRKQQYSVIVWENGNWHEEKQPKRPNILRRLFQRR